MGTTRSENKKKNQSTDLFVNIVGKEAFRRFHSYGCNFIFAAVLFSCVVLTIEGAQIEPGNLRITEFMAGQAETFLQDATKRIQDEDGDYSDWIEVSNLGDTPVNLGIYALRDDS
ncbi:MAG TPA: hypothetical protein EYG38_12090, partial [Verrucomicrobia bacterium]|nr:hypothetical protein [Verrucomicrobiota bacterium]